MNDRQEIPTLREVMACFPTGVTIVTGLKKAGDPFGLTVNSFTSVSLDPPLVLVCIGHSSSSHDHLAQGETFAVNILSSEQGDAALRFASEPSEGRFEDVTWSPAPTGDPVLADAAAWLSCTVEDVLHGGDHSILVGRVEASGVTDRPVLFFHRGRLGSAHE